MRRRVPLWWRRRAERLHLERWNRYKVDLPEGGHGRWDLRRVTISEADSEWSLANAFQKRDLRYYVPPGVVTKLFRYNDDFELELWMSDHWSEVSDHAWLFRRARGRVLICGLGLGMAARACLENPAVATVLVIEKDPGVLALVAPHWQARYGARLRIVEGDAFTWEIPEGARFDVAWFDIWLTKGAIHLPEMLQLHRRFRRHVGQQESWGRYEGLLQLRRQAAKLGRELPGVHVSFNSELWQEDADGCGE